ncbi:MAG: protein tyrosine kinase, partial [Peristeroidobacter soli]
QIVLVVRSGSTPRQAVLDVVEQLGEDRPLSLVLNQGRVGPSAYYGYGTQAKDGDTKASD